MSDAPKAFVPGVVLNALALLAALCSVPALVLPVMKLGFVALVSNPLLGLLALVVGVLFIDAAPVLGLVLALRGRAKGLTIATALISVATFGVMLALMGAVGLHPFVEDGRATGPAPAGCQVKTTDASAIGRACDPKGGPAPEGNCPPEYFCLERVVDHPETNECSLYCSHDCECPSGLKCVYSKCVR